MGSVKDAGDYRFITKLLKNKKDFKRKFVE